MEKKWGRRRSKTEKGRNKRHARFASDAFKFGESKALLLRNCLEECSRTCIIRSWLHSLDAKVLAEESYGGVLFQARQKVSVGAKEGDVGLKLGNSKAYEAILYRYKAINEPSTKAMSKEHWFSGRQHALRTFLLPVLLGRPHHASSRLNVVAILVPCMHKYIPLLW